MGPHRSTKRDRPESTFEMSEGPEPEWLDPIRARIEHAWFVNFRTDVPATLAPAAVLVLLIDGDDGPNILLTQRAESLSNYPGILVFPGGSTETGDDGPVATALREAAEETGIDPTHVHLIGSLPPLMLPASRFVVTPVVGWCNRVEPDTMYSAEVARTFQIPLREFAKASDRIERNRATRTPAAAFSFHGAAVGDMTSAVIDALLDHPTD